MSMTESGSLKAPSPRRSVHWHTSRWCHHYSGWNQPDISQRGRLTHQTRHLWPWSRYALIRILWIFVTTQGFIDYNMQPTSLCQEPSTSSSHRLLKVCTAGGNKNPRIHRKPILIGVGMPNFWWYKRGLWQLVLHISLFFKSLQPFDFSPPK